MFYDHHFFGMYGVWWILLLGVILLVVFSVISYRRDYDREEDALDILKKRFARGEIEREEYEERKRILKGTE